MTQIQALANQTSCWMQCVRPGRAILQTMRCKMTLANWPAFVQHHEQSYATASATRTTHDAAWESARVTPFRSKFAQHTHL